MRQYLHLLYTSLTLGQSAISDKRIVVLTTERKKRRLFMIEKNHIVMHRFVE